MTAEPKALVQRLWDFCDILHDDGLSYGDYQEQLTYLLFLKMADEQHELLGDDRLSHRSGLGRQPDSKLVEEV